MAVGRPKAARAAGDSSLFAVAATGGQQAAIPRRLPIVGDGEDDDDDGVVSLVDGCRTAVHPAAATQPPSSSKMHALHGLAKGPFLPGPPGWSELEARGFDVQGRRKSVVVR